MDSKKIYPPVPGEMLRIVSGSRAAGLENENSDFDQIGIFIEPPANVTGLSPAARTIRFRTAADGKPSQRFDLDLTIFPLRKFMSLAVKGSPHVLPAFFTKPEHQVVWSPWADELQKLAPLIICKSFATRFEHYVKSFERPDMTAKDAANMVRWAMNGWELMVSHRIFLPLPEPELPIAVKEGKESIATAISWTHNTLKDMQEAACQSELRDEPDMDRINAFLMEVHLDYWKSLA